MRGYPRGGNVTRGCLLPGLSAQEAAGRQLSPEMVLFAHHHLFLFNLSQHLKIKKFLMKSWVSGWNTGSSGNTVPAAPK